MHRILKNCVRQLSRRVPFTVRIVFAMAVLVASPIRAQDTLASAISNANDAKHFVTVGLAEDTGFGSATASIFRFAKGNQRNVILLRRSTASSGILEHAMQRVSSSRREHGQVPKHTLHVTIIDRSGESSDAATRALFARLVSAGRYEVPGAGLIPAIQVRIRDQSDDDGERGKP